MSRALWVMLLCAAAAAPCGAARAQSPAVREAQRAQLETLRAEVAAQLQLQAYDLLDELVYGWTQQPVFPVETPVVLADVTSPVGFGTGLDALVENHFASLVIQNRRSNVLLAHCPTCTAVVVHSGAKGTVVSRGVDDPEALAKLGGLAGSRHALFLDFEAEGAALVLRARITTLEPALPIVYARTLTTSTSSAALLRTGDRLKSAAEARQEYLDALEKRGIFLVPLRVGVRLYAGPEQGNSPVAAPPFAWLQLGAEAALTQSRAWTASFSVGGSWAPELHTAWLAQARMSRLLSGPITSLTRPDLYGFVGGSVISVHGQSARIFQQQVPTMADIVANVGRTDFRATFAAFQLGLEMRVKNRIGLGAYLETVPAMADAQGIDDFLDFGVIAFQTFGMEVGFWF
jgi:hypothetical protein